MMPVQTTIVNDSSGTGWWRSSPDDHCPVCGRGGGCSRKEDGLHFCLDSTNAGNNPAFRYLGEATNDPTFGLYRQVGDPGPERPHAGPEEARRHRHERYADFAAGDGRNLRRVEYDSPAWRHLRETFPRFADETLAAIEGVSDPDLYGGAVGFVEYDGAGGPVGVAFRLPGGRKLSRGSRGLTVPAQLRDADPGENPPPTQPPPIYVVEGASDVLACLEMGLLAIGRPSNSGGAADLAQWARTHLPRWRWDFVVLGENDVKADGTWPGRDGMKRVAGKLADALGITVRRALPPAGHKDARAWLEAQLRRKGRPAAAGLGHEFASHAVTSAEAVVPACGPPPRRGNRRRPEGLNAKREALAEAEAEKDDGGAPLPAKARPRDENGNVVLTKGPPVTSGPAATFSAGLSHLDRRDCPYGVARTVRRTDNHDAVKTVCLRCRKMTCEACRRCNVRDYLERAETGVRADLEGGGKLAVFDGRGVSAGAMAKRLGAAGVATAGYLQCHLGDRRLVVCTLAPSSAVPLGFAAATAAEAAAKLREIDALLEHATPFDDVERWRPLSLSKSWLRVSLRKRKKKGQTNSEPDPPGYEVVIPSHAAIDPRVFAEFARSQNLDPLFHPRHGGRSQWSIAYNLAGLNQAEKREFWERLADLRDGDPKRFDLAEQLPDAEPVTVAGTDAKGRPASVELGRVESALFAAAGAAGRLDRPPPWLPVDSCNRLADACRYAGVATWEGGGSC